MKIQNPTTALQAGLAIAYELNQQRAKAIESYRKLIIAGRAEEEPTDWANPETIEAQEWPESRNHPP